MPCDFWRAYGRVACKRVIDDIPMHLITTLVEPLGPQLRAAARPTDEDLRRLLAETRESTSARQRATDQFLAMEAAEEAFGNLTRRRFE